MTKDQAEARAAELNAEGEGLHGARHTESGDWEVVKVELPSRQRERFTTETGAQPQKPDPGQLEAPAQPNPYWGPG